MTNFNKYSDAFPLIPGNFLVAEQNFEVPL